METNVSASNETTNLFIGPVLTTEENPISPATVLQGQTDGNAWDTWGTTRKDASGHFLCVGRFYDQTFKCPKRIIKAKKAEQFHPVYEDPDGARCRRISGTDARQCHNCFADDAKKAQKTKNSIKNNKKKGREDAVAAQVDMKEQEIQTEAAKKAMDDAAKEEEDERQVLASIEKLVIDQLTAEDADSNSSCPYAYVGLLIYTDLYRLMASVDSHTSTSKATSTKKKMDHSSDGELQALALDDHIQQTEAALLRKRKMPSPSGGQLPRFTAGAKRQRVLYHNLVGTKPISTINICKESFERQQMFTKQYIRDFRALQHLRWECKCARQPDQVDAAKARLVAEQCRLQQLKDCRKQLHEQQTSRSNEPMTTKDCNRIVVSESPKNSSTTSSASPAAASSSSTTKSNSSPDNLGPNAWQMSQLSLHDTFLHNPLSEGRGCRIRTSDLLREGAPFRLLELLQSQAMVLPDPKCQRKFAETRDVYSKEATEQKRREATAAKQKKYEGKEATDQMSTLRNNPRWSSVGEDFAVAFIVGNSYHKTITPGNVPFASDDQRSMGGGGNSVLTLPHHLLTLNPDLNISPFVVSSDSTEGRRLLNDHGLVLLHILGGLAEKLIKHHCTATVYIINVGDSSNTTTTIAASARSLSSSSSPFRLRLHSEGTSSPLSIHFITSWNTVHTAHPSKLRACYFTSTVQPNKIRHSLVSNRPKMKEESRLTATIGNKLVVIPQNVHDEMQHILQEQRGAVTFVSTCGDGDWETFHLNSPSTLTTSPSSSTPIRVLSHLDHFDSTIVQRLPSGDDVQRLWFIAELPLSVSPSLLRASRLKWQHLLTLDHQHQPMRAVANSVARAIHTFANDLVCHRYFLHLLARGFRAVRLDCRFDAQRHRVLLCNLATSPIHELSTAAHFTDLAVFIAERQTNAIWQACHERCLVDFTAVKVITSHEKSDTYHIRVTDSRLFHDPDGECPYPADDLPGADENVPVAVSSGPQEEAIHQAQAPTTIM